MNPAEQQQQPAAPAAPAGQAGAAAPAAAGMPSPMPGMMPGMQMGAMTPETMAAMQRQMQEQMAAMQQQMMAQQMAAMQQQMQPQAGQLTPGQQAVPTQQQQQNAVPAMYPSAGMPYQQPAAAAPSASASASSNGSAFTPVFGVQPMTPGASPSFSMPAMPVPAAPPVAALEPRNWSVALSEPQIHDKGKVTQYVTYNVRSKTTMPGYQVREFFVVRRYRDFLWLRNMLVENHYGVIVPPLPEKLAVGRFNPDFIEKRRCDLEHFLSLVCQHATLKDDQHVRAFLEGSDEALLARKPEADMAKLMKNLDVMFRKLGTGEPWLEEARVYLSAIDKELESVCKNLGKLTLRRSALAQCFADFATPVSLLADHDTSLPLAQVLRELSHCSERVNYLMQELSTTESTKVVAPLKHLLRTMACARDAMQQRGVTAAQHQQAEKAMAKAKAKYDKLLDGGNLGKVQEADAVLKSAEAALATAETRLNAVTATLKQEMEALDATKVSKVRQAFADMADAHIEYEEKVGAMWEKLQASIKAIQCDVPAVVPTSEPAMGS